jgi:hypothetical protein
MMCCGFLRVFFATSATLRGKWAFHAKAAKVAEKTQTKNNFKQHGVRIRGAKLFDAV